MQMRQLMMLFIINGGKMSTTDGRHHQSFPPALLPLLLLVLLSGCPPPCKGDQRNSAKPSPAPAPAPTPAPAQALAPAPSLGFETLGNPSFHHRSCVRPCSNDLQAQTLANYFPLPLINLEGFNMSRALGTGHVHGRITPSEYSNTPCIY